MEVVSAAASVGALVEISLKVTSLCAEYYTQVKSAGNDINRFRLEVQALANVLQSLQKLAEKPAAEKLLTARSLTGSIESCLRDLKGLKEKLDPGRGRKAMSRYGVRALKWPFVGKELEKTIIILERHKSTFNTALNTDQTFLILDFDAKLDLAEQDRCLSKLPYADGANFNSNEWQHEPYCLPDTRVDILHQIMKWSADPCDKAIFWLNGMAGTGKSTIARTVARTLNEQNRLAANFFFSRGRGDLSHTGKLFSTVASQLAGTSPALRHYICEAITENDNIARQSMRDQWTQLIYQPLLKLERHTQSSATFVFVVDALDECGRQEEVATLLQLLTGAKDLRTVQLRVLVTSRPETPIQLGFSAIPRNIHEDFILHTISPSIVRHDIAIFLKHELNRIREGRSLPLDWPGKQKLDILVKRSSGLFIYAATVCRFIQDPKWLPAKRLEIVLQENNDGQSPTHRLDEMYIQILRTSVVGDCSKKEKIMLGQRFRDTVGPIIVLFDTLSSIVLAGLLPSLSETIDITLDSLKSVLNIPEDPSVPIQLLHPSFRDFLLNRERCLDTYFWIDQAKTHHNMAGQCLSVMSKTLRRNICRLETPGTFKSETENTVVDRYIPPHVQYACLYWLDHFRKRDLDLDDAGQVYRFLQDHFLHWLEALSLMSKVSEAVLMMKLLSSVPEFQINTNLSSFLNDARRFILEFRSIIETAPLQVYNSALIFSPRASITKRLFSDELPSWIERLPIVEESWSASLQALEGHSDSVRAVVFSPNGQLLASASNDNTVRLWDSSTGASRGTLEGHSDTVNAVVFSPDGQLLASTSDDNTVRLWDPSIGASRGTLEGHSDSVRAVVFSPDGQLLASTSSDSTVRLWDPSTGASQGTLEGHLSWVNAVVFSPDGQLLASASNDKTVRLWDLTRKTSIQQIKHKYNEYISFSEDGLRLELDGRLIDIPSSSLSVFPNKRVSIDASYSLDSQREWVLYKDFKVLWLPPNRRPGVYALRDNILVLGNGSGRITFLQFSRTVVPIQS